MSYDTKHTDILPTAEHIETLPEDVFPQQGLEPQTLEKADTIIDDIAFRVFTNIHAIADDIDPHTEKRLVRKIDYCVIPFICITYLITYIDKATLSYGMTYLYILILMLMCCSRSLWSCR
jgi:hypothetical protein